MPIFRMTAPHGITNLADIEFRPGEVLFRSRILAFGFIPIDWIDLTLVEMEPGRRFVERSRMGSMRFWQHVRTVEPSGKGCIVTDELSFEPKRMATLNKGLIALAFRNRHRQLNRRFNQPQQG